MEQQGASCAKCLPQPQTEVVATRRAALNRYQDLLARGRRPFMCQRHDGGFRVCHAAPEAQPAPAAGAPTAHRASARRAMDFDDLIAAHIRWKIRLSRFLDDTGSADYRSGGRDDACDFCDWLAGAGARYRELSGYTLLAKTHADFHVKATAVVKRLEAGDRMGARAAWGGPFAAASKEIVTAVLVLKNQAKARGIS